jgi:Fe2+ or Zn2+ uptake regulation protein
MMCHECGGIVHFENKALGEVMRGLRDARSGERLTIDGPRTVFYGTCPKCAGMKKGASI